MRTGVLTETFHLVDSDEDDIYFTFYKGKRYEIVREFYSQDYVGNIGVIIFDGKNSLVVAKTLLTEVK